MNKIVIFLIFSIFLALNLSASGHYPSLDIGYTTGTGNHLHAYTVNPNGRQSSLHLNTAQSNIPANANADIYPLFTFDTSGKNIYVVYTTDGSTPTKANGMSISASFSYYNEPDRWWVASIPMIGTASTTVKYMIYISDNSLANSFGQIGANGYQTSGSDPGFSFITLAALPINLINFSATKKQQQALLTWQTSSETNNSHFNIERSSNAKAWSTIGQIQGIGTTSEVQSYSFEDKKPLSGQNYYRLKQLDFDGAYSYSPVISLVHKNHEVQIYPNPVSNYFEVKFIDFDKARAYQLLLTNAQGQLVNKTRLASSSVQVDISHLPVGIYSLSAVNKRGEIVFVQQLNKL